MARAVSDGRGAVPGNRRIYLHIGEPKTGTSFLQHALWSNRAQLGAQGIALPGYSSGGHARASQDLREVRRLAGDPADPWTGEWDVLTGQALRARGAAVISNELLAACNARQADRAMRSLLSAEVHIVVTVRDFATLLPAEWHEAIKCRGTIGWEQWLADVVAATPDPERRRRSWFWTVHDTLAVLGLWSQHIPTDQVHVITLPPNAGTTELWLRFASVLGIESETIDLPRRRANPSLGLAEAEFLRRLNETLPDQMPRWFYTWNIKRILANDVLSARPPQAHLSLPPEQQAWAREQAEVLVAGLRDSKYHIVGDLAELLPTPAAEHYVSPSSLPAEQLLDAAILATAALADRQYRGDIITSSSDLSVGLQPARGRTASPRRMVSRLGWTILKRSQVKRTLYTASRRPAVRNLRVLVWCILTRPGRRAPGLPGKGQVPRQGPPGR
jgi:hypothetical protein